MKQGYRFKYFVPAAMLFFSAFGFGQSINPKVLATTGNYFSGSTGSVSWTLGEVMTSTFGAGNNTLTQGFHQPHFFLTSVHNEENTSSQMTVFPNPSSGIFSLLVDFREFELFIFDAVGQCVYRETISADRTREIRPDLRNFGDGVYFMEARSGEKTISGKVIVQNNP